MNVLLLMIPMALALGLTFLKLYSWATQNGQLDDLETPAYRALNEDPILVLETSKEGSKYGNKNEL